MKLDRSTWQKVRFGEVARQAKGTSNNQSDVHRIVGLEHLDTDVLTVRRWADIDAEHTFTRRFRRGQVLYSKRRVYQRKAARADFDGVCSGDIIVLEALPKALNPDILPILMQSTPFVEHALTTSVGSLSPRTNWSSLQHYQFHLPSADDQKRISELVWAAEEVAEKAEAAVAAAWAVEKRVLEDIYADPSWPIVRVGQAGEVQLGLQRHPKYATGRFTKPYLRVANVGDDRLLLGDVLEMDFNESDFARYALHPKDILLNEGQSVELVGRCAMYNGEIEGCCFQKTLLRFRASSAVLPEFAYGWLRRAFYRGDFARQAKQTTSMAHLSAVRFAAMSFPMPDRAIQSDVVERVAEAREARRRLEEHAARSRRLVRGLIDRIFSEDDPPHDLQ